MEYERIPYASFMWKFGTTSFRTKEFNYMTEKQLGLLKKFWEIPENSNQGWEKKYMAPGQKDIYEIKNRYYDYLVANEFMIGNETEIKYKTAREKTSGLYDMGLINENHRLTEVGEYLLNMSESQAYSEKTELGISNDSILYLGQLLKLSLRISGNVVRPFIIVLHLLAKLGYLTYDEFRYLMPLCIDDESTQLIIGRIEELRGNGNPTVDDVIKEVLLSKKNYKQGLERMLDNDYSEELLLSVGMNRKSAAYDKPYATLYSEMYAVYMNKDYSRIVPMFLLLKKFQTSIAIKWKQLMFESSNTAAVKKDPIGNLLPLPDKVIASEKDFKEFFYITMHVNKAKATLEDYLDLNRRYLGLTNCFLFDDDQVNLDIVPKLFFANAVEDLYKQAYEHCDLLEKNCPMSSICSMLLYDERSIINGINQYLGTSITTIDEVFDEVDRVRYDRFNKMVDKKFSDETLFHLLEDFDSRNDDEINNVVTDNADIPTIFEYILGIIWYKASGRRGKVLDFLKLSLDANLLPITHAAGGEADIVWEYQQTKSYPQHSLLLEATLADKTNQRRMEMEPVSRHLGNHLLRTQNKKSYCIFATGFLNVNVIGDFMNRKYMIYCDSNNPDDYIEGMKIIPLSTNDLKVIITKKISYEDMYQHFSKAYDSTERHPQKWYDNFVNFENSADFAPAAAFGGYKYKDEKGIPMAAEPTK